jgi:DNA-binding XRE family transcriptional regulator
MNKTTSFQEHLAKQYGELGTVAREEFEQGAKTFMIGELIKEARLEANMTQEDLAQKAGTNKSYISRIENGQSDIQLNTLFRIVELGLGKELALFIR